jgi:hypothetical protein
MVNKKKSGFEDTHDLKELRKDQQNNCHIKTKYKMHK